MADNIKVKNIYYMLSYAYQALRESGFGQVAAENFDNIHDLFASILLRGIGIQIKRGLHRDYVAQREPLGTLRGQICISDSIKLQTLTCRKMICSFDEFMEDTQHNQILKSTMLLLLRSGAVKPENKKNLRKLILYFNQVTDITPDMIRWDTLKYHRNNASYKMLINLCWLVVKGLLLTTESGKYYLAKWLSDEQMYRLYERFVLSYYKKEHPEYSPQASYIDWDLNEDADQFYLPAMKSDITLTYREKTLIIDTKWYNHTMQNNGLYNSRTFKSGNLYQIYTYVKNKDRQTSGKVAGVLLYAKTDEIITPNSDFVIGGNRISLKTLDLGQSWTDIADQLESLCSWLFCYEGVE